MNMKEFFKKSWKILLILLLAFLYVSARIRAETLAKDPTPLSIPQSIFTGNSGTVSSDPSYCCERTTAGASCVNAPEAQCNPNYKKSVTSCDTTSYCTLGTCYDSHEGICMENTPQSICESNQGTWDPRKASEVPQ